MRGRRADACALALILIFFLVFFAWLLLPKGVYPVTGDAYFYSYPLRTAAWRMISAGQLPLWTPHVMSGYPLLSMAQVAIGYPLTWGYLFLPGYVAESIYVLAPSLLAPVFTYSYARQIRRSRAASLVAGLAFGWGGGVANALAHSGMLTNAIVWLPLFLVAIERARRRPFVSCLVVATLAYTMSVLNGFGQGFVYVGALALAYAAFISLFDTRRDDDGHAQRDEDSGSRRGVDDGGTQRIEDGGARRGWERWRPLAVALGAMAFSAGLCAFQIMETMRAVRRSVRSAISYETFAEGSVTPRQVFASLALPLYSESDTSAYIAPLALALALAGAWLAVRRESRRREPRVVFWVCVALTSFILMLGSTTPLYRLVYYLPVINRFRVPSRHSFEWTFALAVLAAYGFDFVRAKFDARARDADALAKGVGASAKEAGARAETYRRVFAFASVALCALVGLCWHAAALEGAATTTSWTSLSERQFVLWKVGFVALTFVAAWLCFGVRAPRWRTRLLVCVLALTFFFEPLICLGLWWRYVRKPAARFSTPSVATSFMRAHAPEENRIYTRVNLFADEPIIPPRVDTPDLAAASGLRDVGGYEPLTLARYSRALTDVYTDSNDARPAPAPDPSIFGERSHVLDLLNATYVAVLTSVDDPIAKTLVRPDTQPPAPIATARWEPVYNADGLLIMRNRYAMPRAWLVAKVESVDGEQALRRIRGGGADFDPRRTALLEDAPDELPQLPGGELAQGSTARVVAYEPSRIVVETDAPTPTLLMLSENFYPGWEATVDGRKERIHLADFLLRGVAVPAGRHRIEMRYLAPQARNGALLSAFTLLVLAGLVFVARRRRALISRQV
jgi:hypothetical protein